MNEHSGLPPNDFGLYATWAQVEAASLPSFDPIDSPTANAIAHALVDRFGFLPLSVRYGAAHGAISAAKAWLNQQTEPTP